MRQDSVIRKLSGMTLAQCKTYNMVSRLKKEGEISFRKEMYSIFKPIDYKCYLRMADNTMIPIHNVRIN